MSCLAYLNNYRTKLLLFFGALGGGLFLAGCSQRNTHHDGAYYVSADARIASHENSGSKEDPWTLKALQAHALQPGDTVYFMKGFYEAALDLNASGTAEAPIVLTSFEATERPVFSNPSFSRQNGNVFFITGQHIILDGLVFKDCANAETKEDKKILQVGAVYAAPGADYLTVRNCEFIDCPIGINMNAQHALLTSNKIHDCNRFLSEPDWGPLGILIGNANNEISYNTCWNYVKVGGNYGADGGFIELDDRYAGNKVHDIKIHHNVSYGNQGFLEVEGKVIGDNLDVYYNVSDDFQQFIFYWGGNNSRIENNTVIRTRPSNHGSANTVFTMKNDKFVIRNNIFVVANGIQVLATSLYNHKYGNVIHENNLYFSADASTKDPCGKTLGPGELIVDPVFVDSKESNFHLQPSSPAISAGQPLGYTLDLDSIRVLTDRRPEIGAYQYDGNP